MLFTSREYSIPLAEERMRILSVFVLSVKLPRESHTMTPIIYSTSLKNSEIAQAGRANSTD